MINVIRCPAIKEDGKPCGRFLGKESIKDGRIELMCPICKTWVIVISKIKYKNV